MGVQGGNKYAPFYPPRGKTHLIQTQSASWWPTEKIVISFFSVSLIPRPATERPASKRDVVGRQAKKGPTNNHHMHDWTQLWKIDL